MKVTKGCEWLNLPPTVVTGSASSLVSLVLAQERSVGEEIRLSEGEGRVLGDPGGPEEQKEDQPHLCHLH